MKKETYLHIPEPCHEDWNNMTPQTKGRHCASCAKTVVDFSLMSDTQVLNYLIQSKTSVCGRFATDQLQRPLQPILSAKKKTIWFAAVMPLLVLLSKANAQKKPMNKVHTQKVLCAEPPTIYTVGDTIYSELVDIKGKVLFVNDSTNANKNLPKKINGIVLDENKMPLRGATILLKNGDGPTSTDENGNFKIQTTMDADSLMLNVSFIGYKTQEILVNDINKVQQISMQASVDSLPEVVVTDGKLISCSRIEEFYTVSSGMVINTTIVKKKEIIDTAIRKIFKAEIFKAFPNPIKSGQAINITIKQPGDYSIQLLDNQSKPLTASHFVAQYAGANTTLQIPQSAAAGLYFLRLINNATKKQYTEKIIVQ